MIHQTDVGKRVAVLVEGAVSFKGTVDAVEVTEYSFWLRDAVFVDLDRKVVSGPLVRIRMDSVVAVTPLNEED